MKTICINCAKELGIKKEILLKILEEYKTEEKGIQIGLYKLKQFFDVEDNIMELKEELHKLKLIITELREKNKFEVE